MFSPVEAAPGAGEGLDARSFPSARARNTETGGRVWTDIRTGQTRHGNARGNDRPGRGHSMV